MEPSNMLTSVFKILYCLATFCKHENPSDPLAAQRSTSRSSRLLEWAGDPYSGYDFSKGKLDPIVTTNSGKVEGYVMKSIKGRSIYAFEGIPYAETTGGANRFEMAIPKAPWTGIRPAKKTGEYCLQLHPYRFFRLVGSEDCLFVNVYVPAEPILKWKTNLPVIVWIHGGSWYFGSGAEYGPSYVLEHDVIFVTINFRVGILGFLSTGDKHMPGNLGHKDQRSAFQWVHENIAHFGGDPNRVTIAGQSSGAASVHYHILANSSHKYFSGAISMSGNAFCPWTLMTKRHMMERNRKLAKSTGCPLTNSKRFVDCLRKMNGRKLVRNFIQIFEFLPLPIVPLGVAIEEDHPGAFLTAHPDEIYAQNRAAKVPYICSGTSDEVPLTMDGLQRLQGFYHRLRPNTGRTVDLIFRNAAPLALDYRLTTSRPDSITDQIIDFYMRVDGADRLANASAFGMLASDRMLGYGTHKTLQHHSQVAPTYSYFYSYKGRNSVIATILGLNPKDVGVCHMDDLASVVNITDGFDGYKTTEPEYAVVKLMTSLWYNFAAKGEPLYTDETDDKEHRIWEPITNPRQIQVLQVDKEVKMIPEQYTERLKFWETLDLPDMKPFIRFD